MFVVIYFFMIRPQQKKIKQEKKDGIRNIALHRIKWAKLLEETSVYPKSFNIDKDLRLDPSFNPKVIK